MRMLNVGREEIRLLIIKGPQTTVVALKDHDFGVANVEIFPLLSLRGL
jgi:hypothetical protein